MTSTIDLGFISIHIYSIMILLALLVGGRVATGEAKKWDIPENFMFNLLFWMFIIGIIGARIYYVIFNFDYYGANPWEIIQIWNGGLAIHGGIIFGLIFVLFYCHRYKINKMRMLDILVVGFIIAQAIGRWGNFFNGEAHGPEVALTTLQHLFIPQFVIDGMNINGVYYLPTFYFESIACLIGFIVLLVFRRGKYTKIGQVTGLYLILYGIIRFFIESFRTDSLMLFNLKMAQVVSIVMIICGVIIFIMMKRKGTRFENLYNDTEITENVRF